MQMARTVWEVALRWALLVLCVWGWAGESWSAPPPLVSSHAQFDNDANCARCHEGDNSTPNHKCLVCHKDIDARLRAGTGYHARFRGSPCTKCHPDHRGRGANIIPSLEGFDHKQTGWPLQGKHAGVECKNCHVGTRPGGKTRTYLSAKTECSACHANIHGFTRGSLKQCDKCHNIFGWKSLNANNTFNHNAETRYALEGGHSKVACEKCHMGRDRFAPLAHKGCDNCHEDQHKGLFKSWSCQSCHAVSSFTSISFAHEVPRFRLEGKHKGVGCQKCHTSTNWAPPWKPPANTCNSCHRRDDPHKEQFGDQSCSACHSPKGWTKLNFSHNRQSRFKLVGRHESVACDKCHPNGLYKPRPTDCKSCHAQDDPHAGQFGDKPCENCHTPKDWHKVKFDHTVTRFSLTGAHAEVDCEKCHAGGDLKREIPSSCDGCHVDLHKGQMQPKLCGNCHSFETWAIDNFQHNDQARFVLAGRHMEVACDQCHLGGHFKPIQANCETCHRDFHEGQLKEKVCEGCHSPLGWQETNFLHNRDSEYRLVGQHLTIDCKKCHVVNNYKGLPRDCAQCHTDYHVGEKGSSCNDCHTESSWTTNTAQVHFFGAYALSGEHDKLPCDTCHTGGRELGGLGHECANCHRDPHFASFGPFCVDCHTQKAWLPSTFRHYQTGFRLTGQHRFVRCDNCHINRIYGGLPTECNFCHTDTALRATEGRLGAQHACFNAGNCAECHTTLGWAPVRPAAVGATCVVGGQ
jgi:hypothetical protein